MKSSVFAKLLLPNAVFLAALSILVERAPAAEPAEAAEAAGLALFESKIRPMLAQHCYKCHSEKSGTPEGNLLLDSREAARKGGDRGLAIVPGKPEESLLLTAISHADTDLKMPPKKERLPASVIHDVERWIQLGAPDPRDANAVPKSQVDNLEEARKFWALQTPVRRDPPQSRDTSWAKSAIDKFVLAKLESSDLTPSPDAEPTTLLRRLHFDLVGLPPSPEASQIFLNRVENEGFDAALEAEVDSLLASARFGERWGRHWLDVARFAESSGKEANISFPYAWRYRDYVIDCLNNDVPFDRFLTEQLAGDLLPYADDKERARLLIATGFLALGPKNLDEANAFQFLADVIDEQIDTVTRAVMGHSVACARCHDHKFDPYSMEDYYALAGVFASTNTYFGTFVSPANRVSGDPLVLPKQAELPILHQGIPAKRVEALKAELAALQKEEQDGRAAIQRAIEAGEDPSEIFTLTDALRIFWKSGGIEGQLEKVSDEGEPLPLAMGVLDREQMIDVPLLERGEINRPGDPVARRFPRVIELTESNCIPDDQSGRLEFSRWLTHPDHPLTARVMTNRIWHYLLGAGLVRTTDNFGVTGDPASHPELLDHLAIRFVDNDWSIKKFVREIVLTRTYRQASTYNQAAFEIDPDNRLLWRASKRRLDAEAIRDSMLAASGELDVSRPTGSLVGRVIGDRPISLIGLDARIPSDLDGSMHRSVYLPVLRDRLPDVLDLFDFAEPSLVTGARDTTNVPVQALYLMNSPFVQARAKSLAARITNEVEGDQQRMQLAFSLCFSREPDADELQIAREFFGPASTADEELLTSYCQALLSTAEFRNLD
ncbi:MAG TPA: PSD1 and planctomycete cytochrome C domain-containing protein [Pirellulaceae bacterium]|nr:PSD1 and planctomycete cytochrome C domain-containing protein [Pirellulaceae bacterium]